MAVYDESTNDVLVMVLVLAVVMCRGKMFVWALLLELVLCYLGF